MLNDSMVINSFVITPLQFFCMDPCSSCACSAYLLHALVLPDMSADCAEI